MTALGRRTPMDAAYLLSSTLLHELSHCVPIGPSIEARGDVLSYGMSCADSYDFY